MVNQQQGQYEIVKCVVVGDSGVGKTCLIRALACNAKYDLAELVKTHVATVWAIDHYQNDLEVLDRSWCDVDGVRVSLRLWDTFGYHDKQREFSYKGADVIVLCFSTVKPLSLKNVRRVWYPEIRRVMPTTPIILVGTRADLRYLYNDEKYLQTQKGLLYVYDYVYIFRPIEEKDLITPEIGRDVAKDIGAPYYESSVLSHHGIEDVFINACRAALIERRKLKFWHAQLRHVQRPLIQSPMRIPKPTIADVIIPPSTLNSDLLQLLHHQIEGDVIFTVQGTCIQAHKICLMLTCPIFEELFSLDILRQYPTGKKNRHSLRLSLLGTGNSSTDMDKLIESDTESVSTDGELSSQRMSGFENLLNIDNANGNFPVITSYNKKAIDTVELKYCDDPFKPSESYLQTVVTLNREITPRAFQVILEYLYTGMVKEVACINEIKRAAEIFEMTNLIIIISNLQKNESYLNKALEKEFHEKRQSKIHELALGLELLTDIRFKVDDGIVSAHKPLLMARCEMMQAMFSGDFRESVAEVVPFPGVSKYTFQALQEFLYTDEPPSMTGVDFIDLIGLTNQMCLPRLIRITENFIINELSKSEKNGEDIIEEVMSLLEPCQLHRANQLAKWCLMYLCCHYKDLHQKYHKLYKTLEKENIDYIEKHRWPPVW
ncbi:hypothetical protein LOTGIDRAFT_117662 [Lottia gigantea]|uniref:BTB domain-containing protein n=1 Tax=Lottia gigantea TaxID=225164 RepID=V3ZU73_LOTGI|nr:hypothetical protein LOTGIDRAFT_117662 [Lottia gigantea]ESO95033.1 hypothetical protein LOTGIDRAFT_117662 [Lottia gigantea]